MGKTFRFGEDFEDNAKRRTLERRAERKHKREMESRDFSNDSEFFPLDESDWLHVEKTWFSRR